jgi:hypothetical protein
MEGISKVLSVPLLYNCLFPGIQTTQAIDC